MLNQHLDVSPVTAQLCQRLAKAASELDRQGNWPAAQLDWLGEAGVYRWFIPSEFGGEVVDELQLLDGLLALSQSCLTTTFVLTQWHSACRRIINSFNADLRRQLLGQMADGELFATVGISHLTTSRQHVDAVLAATPRDDGGFELNGYSPWVTGAAHADLLVVGATLPDNRQVLCALPREREGVSAGAGQSLVALSSSCTDQVILEGVRVEPAEVLAGPIEGVLQAGSGGGAGGLQTSMLAVGLTLAAVEFLSEQAAQRANLIPIYEKLNEEVLSLREVLRGLSGGVSARLTAAELRQSANSLALRTTQAALSAAKGAGFVADHPAGRWAREALFFLVWSCPQPVVQANLCEFAQLST